MDQVYHNDNSIPTKCILLYILVLKPVHTLSAKREIQWGSSIFPDEIKIWKIIDHIEDAKNIDFALKVLI